MVSTIETLIAAGVVALNAALLAALLALFSARWRVKTLAFLRANARLLIFMLSAASIAGSLYLEYAASLPPCLMCWWQRIFLYPSAIIAAVAIVKRTDASEFADYILWLSIPGALVALYQHLLQMLPQGTLVPCDPTGECAVRSFFEFGYVTFPWMALSVFAWLILIAFIARKRQSE